MNEWNKTRKKWKGMNPPNHQGAWICGICGMWVYEGEMELDHIEPQGTTHKRQHDLTNLQPTHAKCNKLKGSKRNYRHYDI
jgi:5-methylcytosine-specific restriction endonuclease McrA